MASYTRFDNNSYTVPGMNKWLHRNNFRYKKPMGVPHKFSAEAQQAFVETYEKLQQEARTYGQLEDNLAAS